MKYRKKPKEVEATQWLKHGDHVAVEPYSTTEKSRWFETQFNMEFGIPGSISPACPRCGEDNRDHGFIRTYADGSGCVVCPGAYIVRHELTNSARVVNRGLFESEHEAIPKEPVND